jgi:hypothetical protein
LQSCAGPTAEPDRGQRYVDLPIALVSPDRRRSGRWPSPHKEARRSVAARRPILVVGQAHRNTPACAFKMLRPWASLPDSRGSSHEVRAGDVGAIGAKRPARRRDPNRRDPAARRGSRRQEAIVAASAAPFRRQHHERGLRVPSNARTDVSSQMAMAERTSKGGRSRCSNPASPGRKHQRSANAGRGLRPRFAYARGSADLTSRCWCSVLRSGHLVAALEHYRFDATGELASRCERRK